MSSQSQFIKKSFEEVNVGDCMFHETPGITKDLIRGLGLSTTTEAKISPHRKHFVVVVEKSTTSLKCIATTSNPGGERSYMLKGSDYFKGELGKKSYIIGIKSASIRKPPVKDDKVFRVIAGPGWDLIDNTKIEELKAHVSAQERAGTAATVEQLGRDKYAQRIKELKEGKGQSSGGGAGSPRSPGSGASGRSPVSTR